MTRRARVDAELVRRGLARSRQQAAELIGAGRVSIDGMRGSSRRRQWLSRRLLPSTPMTSGRGCHVVRTSSSVRWMLSVSMWTVADSSMRGLRQGGFTEVLLDRGAREVVAVDVGYGQLAWSLRSDDRVRRSSADKRPRVVPGMIGGQGGGIVADLSFISLATVLPALTTCASPDADIVPMVKPQFEVGKDQVGAGGVVSDPGATETCGGVRCGTCRGFGLAYRRSRSEPTAGTFRQCRILPVVTFGDRPSATGVMNWLPR